MKKVFLTMASVMMLISMAFAQSETPMLPEDHGLTAHQPAWLQTQTFSLGQNWNWWSTYVTGKTIADLETALGENALQIKSSDPFVTYSNGSWQGTLTGAIENDQMYAIQMSAATEIQLRGARAIVSNEPISGASGWNWVGYPVSFQSTVAYALQGYANPVGGDIFKDMSDFATYDGTNNVWIGALASVQPGIGYKMYSQNETFSFYFPAVPEETGREYVASQNVSTTEWQPEMASTPTNMNMIAVVSMDGTELRGEDVEIGVFNGETCRGAIRPMYVEPYDRYMVFLTMYGEDNEPFRFRLLDHETGSVYESDEVSVSYKADDILGALRTPFELKFNTHSVAANALHVFPNPVNHGESFNMTLPGEGMMTVEVINVLGSTMKTVRVEGSAKLSADMAPGIYTLRATDAQGKVYMDKLVVK